MFAFIEQVKGQICCFKSVLIQEANLRLRQSELDQSGGRLFSMKVPRSPDKTEKLT